jgi:hypothetical protein
MSPVEMVHAAVGELGQGASAGAIAAFVERRFGQAIGTRFVPVYLATLRAEEELRRARERAAKIVAEEVEKPAGLRRKGAG